MKTSEIKPLTVKTFAIVVLVAVIGSGSLFLLGTCRADVSTRPSAELKVDGAPLARDTGLTISFAPTVKRVAPSVVSIFTTKRVRVPRYFDGLPFFDDPLFDRWFGQRPDESSRPKQTPEFRKERGLGSGVIVTADGYILTNNHVVDGADEIKIALANEKKQFTARVIGGDSKTDIALLRIDARDLPALTLTDSDLIEVGDVVLAIGNPFGVGQSVSHGIVSAVSRGGLGIEAYEDFIQTDAPINPGNSGGALVDAQGRLIGINTAIASRSGSSAGVGFAVPINMARDVMNRLIADGRVVRGFLGVAIQDLSPELAEEFKVPNAEGALVGSVEPESAAAEAGLRSGDVIVEYDGERVVDSRQLRLRVAHTPPGTRSQLKVLRDGKSKTFTVTLKELPGDLTRHLGGSDEGESDEVLKDVVVTDLTAEARRTFDVPDSVEGALVSEVARDSAAYEAGLRAGDVIQEIDRRPIRDAEEAIEATRNVPGGRVLLRVWSQGGSRYLVVQERD